MPGVPWWAVIAGLSEAAKLVREFGQRRSAGVEPAVASPRRPQTDSSSSSTPLEAEIQNMTGRLEHLEALRAEDNEITARLGQHLQDTATLLGKFHYQLRVGLILASLALLLALLALILLAAK